ncbi:MAG: biotin/lipoyl-binding protein, partial [Desulfovibrionaceae bacterium]|nr:biotin/lipoyl-binding protein [Desulfovibrionaceae bacterium]
MDDRKPEVPGGESLPPEDGIQAKARRARSMFEPSSLMPKGLLPEDLPYAAEVQASLARRPERGSRMLSLGTLLFFVVLFIWASIATLDEVTHADGQVIPSSRTQIIENLEGGILAEVFVHEGQIVEKGDILARIDNESAESSLRDAMNKAMENCAAIIRLRTIITSRDMLVWPEDMAGAVQKACGQMPTKQQMDQLENTQRMQEQIFEVQLRQRNAELDVLRDQVRQRTQELDQRQARLDHLKKTRGLIREQVALAAPLVSKGSYSRARYLSMEERSARIQSEIATLEASLPRAETAAEEARHRLELRRAEMDAELVNEANRRTLELGTQREILSAGLDRVTRTELRSPVRGTVNKIYLNTLGGV